MTLQSRIAVMGGADPSDPLEPDNRLRHTAVGVLILAVACWALIATAFTFHKTVHVSWPMALVAGVLVAAVIIGIDLALTSSPFKKDSVGARLSVIGLRGMVSVAMGLVISHATILLMYSSSLSQIVAARNQDAVASDTVGITEASPYPAQIAAARDQIKIDNAKITAADHALTVARNELDKRKRDWLNDRLCVHGNRAANGDYCGRGDVANQLEASYRDYLANTWPAAQRLHDSAITKLNNDIATQATTVKTATARLNDAIQAGTRADIANTGLIAQSQALWSLLKHDWFAWLWVIFFIVIDLAVGFAKGVLPESDFDLRRRTERQQKLATAALSRNDPLWSEVARHLAKNDAAVMIARSDAERERKIATIQSGVGPQPRARRPAWLAAAVVAAAGLVAVVLATGGHHDTMPSPPNVAADAPSNSYPTPGVEPVAYKLTRPSRVLILHTSAYLRTRGQSVVTLHKAAKGIDTEFRSAACRRGQRLITDHMARVVASIPDPTLRELVLDEVHELAAQGGCTARQDASTLHEVVGVTSQRLDQLGVSS